MENTLRLTVGMLGNASSLLLYAAPMLTFASIIKKKSTGEFSCVPYVLALTNCYFYTWYGLPIVSCEWENFTIVPINGTGVLFELSFILIYMWFAPAMGKKAAAILLTAATLIFIVSATISAVVFHNHHHRKILIGSIGLVASIAMYCSPLVAVRQVLKTKSVEFMPFYLSLFSFLTSVLWMAHGLLSHDIFLAAPNLVGCPVGLLQLVVYFKYRKMGIMEEPQTWDVEKAEDKTKQQLQVVLTNVSDAKM